MVKSKFSVSRHPGDINCFQGRPDERYMETWPLFCGKLFKSRTDAVVSCHCDARIQMGASPGIPTNVKNRNATPFPSSPPVVTSNHNQESYGETIQSFPIPPISAFPTEGNVTPSFMGNHASVLHLRNITHVPEI